MRVVALQIQVCPYLGMRYIFGYADTKHDKIATDTNHDKIDGAAASQACPHEQLCPVPLSYSGQKGASGLVPHIEVSVHMCVQ